MAARAGRWAAIAAAASLSGAAPAPPMPEALVSIDNFTFAPQRLTVAAGTRVTWTNHDDIPHTVLNVEQPAARHSPPLDADDQFSLVLDEKGLYHFFCTLHPHMQSEVLVQ